MAFEAKNFPYYIFEKIGDRTNTEQELRRELEQLTKNLDDV